MEPKPLSELLEGHLEEREKLRRRQADELKAARLDSGLSQEKFAAFAGISQPYLSQVENGSRTISTPTLETMTQAFAAPTSGGTNAPSTSTAKEDAAKARKRTS